MNNNLVEIQRVIQVVDFLKSRNKKTSSEKNQLLLAYNELIELYSKGAINVEREQREYAVLNHDICPNCCGTGYICGDLCLDCVNGYLCE